MIEADIETDRPVLAAHRWPSNAHLIEDCVRLGYLKPDWITLDPTFGKGNWWVRWKPETLITHDLRLDGVDFRHLPYPRGMFDAVAYDPPYVSVGGRGGSTGIPHLHDAYGLTDAPRSPAELQDLINDGIAEAHRVLRDGGHLLVKCQDYVSSGKLWIGTHLTLDYALQLNFEVLDRLEMIFGPRPQPPGRRQLHARRNLSTLFVLRKRRWMP